MSLETIAAYALATVIFGLTPGPGVFAVIAQSITRGLGPAFLMLLGILAGDFIYLIAALTGLGVLAKSLGSLFVVIKLCGAAYLLYLAWKSWTTPINRPEKPEKKAKAGSLLAGLTISVSNPKVIVFYLAFLPTFFDLQALTGTDLVAITAVTIGVLFLVMAGYVLGAVKLRQTISKPRPQKWFQRISGTLMAGAGVMLAARS